MSCYLPFLLFNSFLLLSHQVWGLREPSATCFHASPPTAVHTAANGHSCAFAIRKWITYLQNGPADKVYKHHSVWHCILLETWTNTPEIPRCVIYMYSTYGRFCFHHDQNRKFHALPPPSTIKVMSSCTLVHVHTLGGTCKSTWFIYIYTHRLCSISVLFPVSADPPTMMTMNISNNGMFCALDVIVWHSATLCY